MTSFFAVVRGLAVAADQTLLIASYRNGSATIPLTFMVDRPMPTSGFSTTAFGNLYIPIARLGSPDFVIDGLGLFGPINGTATTLAPSGNWFQAFGPIPMPPLGLSFVAQVLSYDSTFLYSLSWWRSDPCYFNL